MSRFDRNTWFERLVALRNDYGHWIDDTEAEISIAYAEAVLTADEPGLPKRTRRSPHVGPMARRS